MRQGPVTRLPPEPAVVSEDHKGPALLARPRPPPHHGRRRLTGTGAPPAPKPFAGGPVDAPSWPDGIGQAGPDHLRLREPAARRPLLERGTRLRPPGPARGLRLLGGVRRGAAPEERDSWSACSDPEGVGPRLFFQRVPEGKVVKNRLHLDIRAGTGLVGEARLAALESECVRLEALGATRGTLLLADEENESCQNMQDVEGNEFCLD